MVFTERLQSNCVRWLAKCQWLSIDRKLASKAEVGGNQSLDSV